MHGFKTKYLWCTHCAERDWNLLRVTVSLSYVRSSWCEGVRVPITFSAQSSALLLEAETKMDLSVIL